MSDPTVSAGVAKELAKLHAFGVSSPEEAILKHLVCGAFGLT